MAAIEKDLKLVPSVSNAMKVIQEDEEECEMSAQLLMTKRKLDLYPLSDAESPEFPKRFSNDEVHRASKEGHQQS